MTVVAPDVGHRRKLLGIPLTTAVGVLVRSREKGLLDPSDALPKLTVLAESRPLSLGRNTRLRGK